MARNFDINITLNDSVLGSGSQTESSSSRFTGSPESDDFDLYLKYLDASGTQGGQTWMVAGDPAIEAMAAGSGFFGATCSTTCSVGGGGGNTCSATCSSTCAVGGGGGNTCSATCSNTCAVGGGGGNTCAATCSNTCQVGATCNSTCAFVVGGGNTCAVTCQMNGNALTGNAAACAAGIGLISAALCPVLVSFLTGKLNKPNQNPDNPASPNTGSGSVCMV